MFPKKFPTNDDLNCEYLTQCSGCQIASMNKVTQIEFKKTHFTDLWKKTFNQIPTIEFIRPIEYGFRDRVDLTVERDNLSSANEGIEHQKIGFYKKDSRDILDIKNCPLMSEKLSQLYQKIRTINFPVSKGSLRIRVSPLSSNLTGSINQNYLTGIWMDFSNEDIKKLLDEKSTLIELTKICDVIEIGQKRKRLSISKNPNTKFTGGDSLHLSNIQLKLIDPQTEEWFETYDKNLNPIPLSMNVGSFSQTGFKTNKELIKQLLTILKSANSNFSNSIASDSNLPLSAIHSGANETVNQTWLELCSGSGNLTFPLLSVFSKVIATELDENSVESLKSTAEKLNLSENLRVEKINIHRPSEKLEKLLSNIDGLLADPPRSGLQGFLEVISKVPKENLPKNFVYVSCFAETLISDLKILNNLGYSPQKIIGVDQFPHSTHCEWIVHLLIK